MTGITTMKHIRTNRTLSCSVVGVGTNVNSKKYLSSPHTSMQTMKPVFHPNTRTTKPKRVIQTKAIQTTAKVNCILMTKPRDRGRGKVNQCKTRTHFGDRPTIPLLIIQSNFGEELQVEAGLPSFMHRQRVHLGGKQLLRQSNIHWVFYRPGKVLKEVFFLLQIIQLRHCVQYHEYPCSERVTLCT